MLIAVQHPHLLSKDLQLIYGNQKSFIHYHINMKRSFNLSIKLLGKKQNNFDILSWRVTIWSNIDILMMHTYKLIRKQIDFGAVGISSFEELGK
jgi:hypothetical protein